MKTFFWKILMKMHLAPETVYSAQGKYFILNIPTWHGRRQETWKLHRWSLSRGHFFFLRKKDTIRTGSEIQCSRFNAFWDTKFKGLAEKVRKADWNCQETKTNTLVWDTHWSKRSCEWSARKVMVLCEPFPSAPIFCFFRERLNTDASESDGSGVIWNEDS